MKIKSIKHIISEKPIQFYDVIEARPWHNFLIKSGNKAIISHNCSFEDEVSFQPTQDIEKQKKKARELISSIDARMSSRFMHGEKLPTLHILASSKRTDQSFLETYIDMKKKNESKTTLIIDEPQWVIRTDKDSPKKFAVAVGNKFLDSEVLPLTYTEDDYQLYRDKGYQILMVPMGYHEQFLDDINIALTDIAGISTSSSTNYISGVRWTQCRNDKLKNPFTREILEIGNDPADTSQYYDFFDLTNIPADMKSKPLFIHLDMSISGDKTGIGGVWIKGKRPEQNGENGSKELYYQVAFSVSIKAPKGRQVSFDKNRRFIYWLREQGFNIKGISYDTFCSADLGQALQAKGFVCSIISVDRLVSAGSDTRTKVCLPYQTFRNAIYEGRLAVYPTKLLTAEVVGLVRDGNGKIDHSPAGINCLTGDTKLSLTDGRELPIKDVINEYRQGKVNYVYSYNEKSKHIEPKKITNGWCSGIADRIIKITLDNGEVIEATPDHKFLLRSGEYVCAKNLVVNDSMMPLYRKYYKEGALKNYRMYYDPMFDQWQYEHIQFAKTIYDKKYLVHHIDCNEQRLERYHNSDKYKEILAMNALYGIDYEKLPFNEKISYIHRYHNSLNKKLKNHKIAKIEVIECMIPVYDITVEDNHSFALSAGILVHNSKDAADSICGALYDASLHSEEYEYNYGDTLEQILTINNSSSYDDPKQLSLNLETELIQMYGQRAVKGKESKMIHPSDDTKPTENFSLYNDIIIL